MPNKKISDLTSGSAISGTEELPIVQSSTTVKTTINAIKTYFNTIFAAISSPTFIGTVTTPAINVSGLTASQIVGTDASKNLVSIPFGTTAGTVLEGDRITQTITNGVTDKAPSEDAVFDALLNFNDRNLSLRKTQDSATITGTTSETILESILIPANTFSVDDVINLECRIRRVSPTGSTSHRIRVNTSNSLSGATLVGIVTNSNTVLMPSFNRNLLIKSSSNTEVMNTSATFSFDIGSITSAASSINIDWATDKYLIISVQPSVNTESNTLSYLLIETK